MSLWQAIIGKFKKKKNLQGHQNVATTKSEKPARENPDRTNTVVIKNSRYQEVVALIDRIIKEEEITLLRKREQNQMTSYYIGNRKVFIVLKGSDPPRVLFLYSGAAQTAKELNARGLRPVSRNEARQKGFIHAKAVYTGSDPEVLRTMIKAAK